MVKKITFHSTATDFEIARPMPSSRFIPSWFRKMDGVKEGVMTVKKCVPFLDALTSGYMVPLPADVYWSSTDKKFTFNAPEEMVSDHHLSQSEDVKIPEEYDPQPHKWLSNWHVKTPRGYSSLILHPINRLDLPFYSFSGIVDTDKHPMVINFPFVLRKGFDGKIEAGTPIVQIIPFKRDRWSANFIDEGPSHFYEDQHRVFQPPFGYYKRNFWDRKYFS